MPSQNALLAFALASLVLVVVPGPSVLVVVGRSLTLGRRHGLLSVLGNGLGALPLVVALALGVRAIRHRRGGLEPDSVTETGTVSPLVSLRQAFVVGVSNPKPLFSSPLPCSPTACRPAVSPASGRRVEP